MTKYHINNEQKAGVCRAKSNNCRFGTQSEHFDSAEAAQVEVERRLKEAHGGSAPSKSVDSKMSESLTKLQTLAKKREKTLDEAEALRESIRPRFDELSDQIKKNNAQREKVATEILESVSASALRSNPEVLSEVFVSAWGDGRGSNAIVGAYHRHLARESSIWDGYQTMSHYGQTRGYEVTPALSKRMSIPRGFSANEEELERAAKSIEANLEADQRYFDDQCQKLAGDGVEVDDVRARVEITCDKDIISSFDTFISRDEETGVIRVDSRSFYEPKMFLNAKEALKFIEKKAPYGATEQYAKENSDWKADLDSENDDYNDDRYHY